MGTILILENDNSTGALSCLPSLNRHSILKASSADEVFDCVDQSGGLIDLLVFDVSLPEVSGIRLARKLHAILPGLRTILTSQYPPYMWDSQDVEEFMDFPAKCMTLVQPPISPTMLLGELGKCHRTETAVASAEWFGKLLSV